MGREFSACQTGLDRMTVTSVTQSWSLLRELLLQSQQNSSIKKKIPHVQRFVGQISVFFLS